MVLSITRAAGSCRKLRQFPPAAHSSSLASARSFNGEVWCLSLWERESCEKSLVEQPGSSRKYKSWGRGRGGGGIKVLGRARESKTQRSMCTPAHIPHRIGRPDGILPQCVRERGIDSNQKWDVRPGEELQGI